MAGTRRATSSNEARSSSSTTESRTATTVAGRNPPAKKAISPIGWAPPIFAPGELPSCAPWQRHFFEPNLESAGHHHEHGFVGTVLDLQLFEEFSGANPGLRP